MERAETGEIRNATAFVEIRKKNSDKDVGFQVQLLTILIYTKSLTNIVALFSQRVTFCLQNLFLPFFPHGLISSFLSLSHTFQYDFQKLCQPVKIGHNSSPLNCVINQFDRHTHFNKDQKYKKSKA